MKYPLAQKAVAQMKGSYAAFGSIPDQVRELVGGALEAIDLYIDRPEGEKEALMAATALFFSTDMTVYKELPPNIAEYGDAIKQILSDALASPSKPFGVSRDLMQIGLALSLPSKHIALDMLDQTREKLEDLAQDPALLKQAIKKMQEAIVKGQKDGALHFTGEQPRLEAKARDVMDAIRLKTETLVNYMLTLLGPPAGPPPVSPSIKP